MRFTKGHMNALCDVIAGLDLNVRDRIAVSVAVGVVVARGARLFRVSEWADRSLGALDATVDDRCPGESWRSDGQTLFCPECGQECNGPGGHARLRTPSAQCRRMLAELIEQEVSE